MIYINRVNLHPTVDFAASEMKKYLRMMMPEGGESRILYAPDATEGFLLGLMSDFALDTSTQLETFRQCILGTTSIIAPITLLYSHAVGNRELDLSTESKATQTHHTIFGRRKPKIDTFVEGKACN